MLLAEVLAEGRQYKIHQKHPTCVENVQEFKNEKNNGKVFFLNGRFKRRELELFQRVIEIQI